VGVSARVFSATDAVVAVAGLDSLSLTYSRSRALVRAAASAADPCAFIRMRCPRRDTRVHIHTYHSLIGMCTYTTSIDMLIPRSTSSHARGDLVLDPPGGAAEQPCCLRLGAERDSLHSEVGAAPSGVGLVLTAERRGRE
jgi:hypothetical protein